jgi:methyltransferase (TIGR00027 family)
MKRGVASRTAEIAALHRALHLRLAKQPILADPYAEKLIRPTWRMVVQSRVLRTLYQRFVNDLRPSNVIFAARSRIAEDLVADKSSRGPVQWVQLGAGLDMFAWRHPQHAKLAQFELDHPDTQAQKRALVGKLGLAPPPNHRFVAIDFERTKISDALRAAGFDPSVPAVFAWLGVTYYLTRDAIRTTLSDVASLAAPGSAIMCDYRLPDRFIYPPDLALARSADRMFEKWGEPHISKLEPDDWRSLAEATGWTLEADLDHEHLDARFDLVRTGFRPVRNYRMLTLGR